METGSFPCCYQHTSSPGAKSSVPCQDGFYCKSQSFFFLPTDALMSAVQIQTQCPSMYHSTAWQPISHAGLYGLQAHKSEFVYFIFIFFTTSIGSPSVSTLSDSLIVVYFAWSLRLSPITPSLCGHPPARIDREHILHFVPKALVLLLAADMPPGTSI